MNILLLTLEKEKNLGDAVIAKCTKYILDDIIKKRQYDCKIVSQDFKYVEEELIRKSDLIIFAGGGLIDAWITGLIKRIDEITLLADKLNIDIIFNAIGVQGFEENWQYSTWIKIINRKCVKFISTRDNIDLLNKKYIKKNKQVKTMRVADPAVWASDVYGISKNKESKTIGLGIIRSGIFEDNGINFTKGQQLDLWSNIIRSLNEKGEEWILFTNGSEEDYNFAIEILNYIGNEHDTKNKILRRPIISTELVGDISSFKAIIAPRLHANIIAYSLGIPSVGIIWNPKVKWFGKITGNENRFFDPKDCKIKDIIEELYKAMNQTYEKRFLQEYKKTTYQSLGNILEQYLEK